MKNNYDYNFINEGNIIVNEFETNTGYSYPVTVTFNKGYYHKTSMDIKIPQFYLENIIINEGIEEIPPFAVADSEKLTNIKFPSTLKEIGESAFEGCSSLKNIKFPEGVERIYKYAFAFCYDLETVIIPSSMKSIETNAFHRCINLKYFIVLNPEMDVSNIELPDECKIIRGVEEKR